MRRSHLYREVGIPTEQSSETPTVVPEPKLLPPAAPLAQLRQSYRELERIVIAQVEPVAHSRVDIIRMIVSEAHVVGVPAVVALAFALIEDESLDPSAVSSTGATGIYQLTKPAVQDVRDNFPDVANLDGQMTDPGWNIKIGIRYIELCRRRLHTSYATPWRIYAAYNLGVGNALKLERGQTADRAVESAVSVQATALSAAGPRGYLLNASKVLASASARAVGELTTLGLQSI